MGDFDFPPFEFVNVDGEPDGYNVEVLNMILDELDIPHKFIMQDWHVATDMFERREADIIYALYYFFKDRPYVSTHKFINYYNLKVARRADTEPLNYLSDLKATDTILVKEDDYAAMALADFGSLPFTIEFSSPNEGMHDLWHHKYKYYIWGELPLTHKIQELGLDSIVLDEIDIPAGEMRVIGYNKDLIEIIDDQYARLEQAGELQEIYDHWFHPEREHDDTSPVSLFIIGGLLLAAIAVFLLIRLIRRKVRITVRESSDLGQMMDRVLNMGNYFVIEWDFKTNMLRNKYGNMIPNGQMKPEEFLERMPPEEAQQVHSLNMQLISGVISHFDMNLRFNRGTQEHPVWKNYYGNGIVEKEDGITKYILYTIKDITEEVDEERRIRTSTTKYKKMFDTNLVPMSFYDAEGHLLDLNQKMRELCCIDSAATYGSSSAASSNEDYFRATNLFSFPNLKGVYLPGSREVIYVCQHIEEPELSLDKYIEFRIRPVINDNDELVYYIVTSRDVTEERNMYLQHRKHDSQLHNVNDAIKRYENQLGYLLEESKMYIWNYLLAENVVYMTRTPGQNEFSETIEEYVMTANPEARQRVMEEMQKAIQQAKPYNTIVPFDRTPLDDQPTWYAISGIPIFNKDGQLTEYFGLSRNITEIMQAQEKLRVETAHAEDSGRLKAAFLANMTHEIRTPLNAIVGFSDLLPIIEDQEEKKEMIRIIRNNCDMLLRLIRDILEASNIDSRPMDIKPADIDFAQAFDEICQTLEQRFLQSPVRFIKDNPYTSFPTKLDKERIQQVITNFVTNAIKYTKQGHIKVGYIATCSSPAAIGTASADGSSPAVRPIPPAIAAEIPALPGLFIYCEDTGTGIPKEQQPHVFERFVKLNEFVQGTGLGLNICKSITERCGGKIGVYSDGQGQGSTFWMWVPCDTPPMP